MAMVEVKALGGLNYVRPDQVVAVVQQSQATQCSIVLLGGTTVNCAESSKMVAERIAAALAGA